jgi:hypothetical protein
VSQDTVSLRTVSCNVLMVFICSEFGLAFMQARERCHARTRYGSFDTSVLEINKADLMMFLEALTEAMDGPDY